uniref:Enoyl-CoA hydratase n=1 Tax=Candidatus Kentrum sp. MB TaxID=2138164 RepID=A0A450XC45_9GAMM|nr:MAG: enoyl-CoA hydratase [Candidatus Kentron sp. MB]VFK29308.1 MAG: enoyl-CoA hydratase [Candidatus Kentron sp. MB]VFK74739.1 MAG: enoyl-CoA hydratase [Candidatus Kentron sp. MB]
MSNTTLSGTVRMERIGKPKNIALFTLDRPEKVNAYHNGMIAEFAAHLTEAIADPSIRVGVVTGAGGKVFCAGADVSGFPGRSYEDGLELPSRKLFDRWANAPWPTIAAMEGPAIAGGFELALACDYRICSYSSWFSLPEIDLGLIPAAGGVRRLGRIVNEARAREMILFGRKVDSATALEWGIVSGVSHAVLADAVDLATSVARRDPLALRLAKVALQSSDANQDTRTEALIQALLYHRKTTQKI